MQKNRNQYHCNTTAKSAIKKHTYEIETVTIIADLTLLLIENFFELKKFPDKHKTVGVRFSLTVNQIRQFDL